MKNFTQDQKDIRWKYRNKMAKKISREERDRFVAEMQKAFKEMAGDEE